MHLLACTHNPTLLRCPVLCVHTPRGVCLCGDGGRDRREPARRWRCGNSRGVVSCLPVGMKLIPPLVHSVFSSFVLCLTHTKHTNFTNSHRPKPQCAHRPHVCTGTQRAHTHTHTLTRRSVATARRTEPAICSAQSFPERSKTGPALNSRLSRGPAGTHATAPRTQATRRASDPPQDQSQHCWLEMERFSRDRFFPPLFGESDMVRRKAAHQ